MRPTLDEIRDTVAAPMARRGVVRAGVFGSFARGEATESSDVDFLVEFEEGRTLLDLSGLRIAGARDILVHEYFRVDVAMAWNMVQKDLLILEMQVRRMLDELGSSDD